MPTIAIYPGSFDPPTEGHKNIIERASKLFDQVIVAIAVNSAKQETLSPEERVTLLKGLFQEYPNIQIESFQDQLLIHYVQKKKAQVIVRGLRTFQDYEYEFQMALANKQLAPEIETVFIMADARYAFLSSTLIKEIVRLGGSCEGMLSLSVEKKLKEKLKKSR
ncbi:MAG: pantetheine-phosphate adenylyltransferase [Deltaproteobacteria bacterium]|nr:pantetheine-phosphate adenylyltransferase [Deltaproteobacteria bacterium]